MARSRVALNRVKQTHTVNTGRIEKKQLQSITEETDLDQIMAEAALAGACGARSFDSR